MLKGDKQQSFDKPHIVVLGKTYVYIGRSHVWKMINPNKVRLFSTWGILTYEWDATTEEEKGEWVEVYSDETSLLLPPSAKETS